MQFYTVVLKQKHSVSRFDSKGNLIGREETEVEQKICDLPWATAKMYQDKDPAGTCQIITQPAMTPRVRGEGHKHRVKFGDTRSGKSARPEPTRTAAPAAKSKTSSITNAAQTGDLSAAINAGE